jgi:hypothetical protein
MYQAPGHHHAIYSITYFTHMVGSHVRRLTEQMPRIYKLESSMLRCNVLLDYSSTISTLAAVLSPPALPALFPARTPAGSTVVRNDSRSPAPVLCCTCLAVQRPVQRRHLWALLVRPSGCISNQPIPVVLQQPHRHFRSASARHIRPGARAHIRIFS